MKSVNFRLEIEKNKEKENIIDNKLIILYQTPVIIRNKFTFEGDSPLLIRSINAPQYCIGQSVIYLRGCREYKDNSCFVKQISIATFNVLKNIEIKKFFLSMLRMDEALCKENEELNKQPYLTDEILFFEKKIPVTKSVANYIIEVV